MDLTQLKTRPVVIRRKLSDHCSGLGLDEQDLIILIELLYASEISSKQPFIEFLQKGSTMEPRQITSVIQNLIQGELLELNVNKDEEDKFIEYMNLGSFYHKLNQLLKHQYLKHEEQDRKEQFKQLFQVVEQSFGRPLSPYGIEALNQWIDVDHHDLSVIQAALDEILNQNKLSSKYIDCILLNRKKNNMKTVDDSKKIREQFNKPKMRHVVKKVPKFDWLNGENPNDK